MKYVTNLTSVPRFCHFMTVGSCRMRQNLAILVKFVTNFMRFFYQWIHWCISSRKTQIIWHIFFGWVVWIPNTLTFFLERGHVHSAHAVRGEGGFSKCVQMHAGGRGVWPMRAHAMGIPRRPPGVTAEGSPAIPTILIHWCKARYLNTSLVYLCLSQRGWKLHCYYNSLPPSSKGGGECERPLCSDFWEAPGVSYESIQNPIFVFL